MSDKKYYSYEQIHQIVKEMSEQIIASKCEIDIVVSIATGGWIPARILRTFLPNSGTTGLPMPLFSIGLVNYDSKDKLLQETLIVQELPANLDIEGKNILLVDEVADSGGTFVKAEEYILSKKPKKLYTAVLHLKDKSKFIPDFVGERAGDDWIVYPWDVK